MTAINLNIKQSLVPKKLKINLDALLTGLAGLGLITGIALQISGFNGLALTAYGLVYICGGLPAAIGAFKELFNRRLDIDLLMVLAAVAAAAVGEVRDGAILLFLFSLAGTLEAYALGNTKRAVEALMELKPDEANLKDATGSIKRVPVEQLSLVDTVVVKPGERVPIDGTITQGQSAIDQSPITGESIPVDKYRGDSVFAGTVNGFGVLEIQVTKLASESTLSRMVSLVTEAQETRSPSENFSQWFGQRYTVIVLFGSIAALIGFKLFGIANADAFYKAATLLVVASPCAIVISVPAAVLSALASAARRGVLFKGGAALEDFGQTTILAVDKTGTLTEGKMYVTDVIALSVTVDVLLAVARALETHSEHPIARSILNHIDKQTSDIDTITANNVQAIPGKGLMASIDGKPYWAGNKKLAHDFMDELEASILETINTLQEGGKTIVIIGSDSILGIIAVADTPRLSAKSSLKKLRSLGIQKIAMLTGDNANVAFAVAKELGIDKNNVYASLLPQSKVDLVNHFRKEGKVAFIGDGVNDAAALASAHVGVAMGSAGSDVALEAADVALLSDDLSRLPDTLRLARKTNRIIKQNLVFALGIMFLMVIITIFWQLPLPLGVIGHEGGTLLVVANGLRLLWFFGKRK